MRRRNLALLATSVVLVATAGLVWRWRRSRAASPPLPGPRPMNSATQRAHMQLTRGTAVVAELNDAARRRHRR